MTTSRHWIAEGPLVPWMFKYLQWLAEQPDAVLSRTGVPGGYRRGLPTTAQRTAAASGLAKRRITSRAIAELEQRPDVVDYFTKLRADAQYLARELMRQDIVASVEARREALEYARRDQDVKAIDGLTRWVPDVAFPKKLAEEDRAPRVVIHLGSKQAARLIGGALEAPDEEIVDVEYEVVEPKQLTDGEED